MHRIIHIQADAPLKPPIGTPCNGCGVCCLAEPCPLGMLVSGRRRGACRAVRWDAAAHFYRCGLIVTPQSFVRPVWLARIVARLARRWVAVGQGCDSDLALADDRALR